ncbi:MAG: hypothetical protein JXA97_04900 [Anaerolineales bacterium]|nr:hypothetical protein [Anaerolineales bacterium]
MNDFARRLGILLFLMASLTACQAAYLAANVSREDLQEIVLAEAVAFDTDDFPDELGIVLATHDVVFLGEVHNLQDHADLLVSITEELQPHGFQQIFLECFQAFDWILNAYALGEDISLHPYLDRYYGTVLDRVRAINLNLPAEERIRVRAIDINHDPGALSASLHALSPRLQEGGELEELALDLNTLDWNEQAPILEAFQTWLGDHEEELTERWGQEWIAQIEVMIDVQMESIAIKQRWDSDYHGAHRLREEIISGLVDELLSIAEGGTIINMGFNHAQLMPLRGTRQVWLGEYLRNTSEYAGEVYILCVNISEGYHVDDIGLPEWFTLMDESRENELMRVMWETMPGEAVFLPLQMPFFQERRIPVNYLGDVRIHHPADVYDGMILLDDVLPLLSLNLEIP